MLFSAKTRVYDADGHRLSSESSYDGKLDNAESVRIVGKIARPDKWLNDDDGTSVTTIRAKKVFILS
ncbi:MAG: hypothetical protein JO243_02650 [Solirubrobacterales bacterium]|nr:hypothetical protein [Solirubrobacterales bacterium]